MTESLPDLLLNYWYAWLVGLLLAGIAVGFAVRFVVPARRLGRELAAAIEAMTRLGETHAAGGDVDVDAIAATAMASPRLARLWADYAVTLHRQPGSGGQAGRWRATALAESFFTEQALVDSPLKTEFYKHLPGILTGLGIIGTFTGLIIGLIHFDVSLDPNRAQGQLRQLINSVGHAFLVSALAISLAMLFTWIEKSLLTIRYRQVERLRELIDGLFDVGVDVEYLERLVLAAETSAAQAGQIRDGLAEQLRESLVELAERQAEVSARQGERLAADLGRVIGERLGQPIAAIAAAVDSVGARQDEVVSRMLGEVLAGFSAQMQNLFAAQMEDSSDLLRQTNAAVAATGERQQEAGRQLTEAVAQLQAGTAEAQARSAEQLEQALARVGDRVAAAVGQLQDQARAAGDVHQEQVALLSRRTGEAVGGMASQVERLIAGSIEASLAVQAAVDRLSATTGEAVAGMGAGAETLAVAAADFARAGQGVAETMNASTAATAQVHGAAQMLSMAATATQDMVAAQAQSQQSFAALAAELRLTVDQARRDGAMSAELVERLHGAAAQLSAVQRKSEDYLRSVNDVLVQAHQSFADNVERTLREGNRQFHLELAQAVGLLSGAVQDLGDLVDTLPAARPRP